MILLPITIFCVAFLASQVATGWYVKGASETPDGLLSRRQLRNCFIMMVVSFFVVAIGLSVVAVKIAAWHDHMVNSVMRGLLS